MSSPQPTIHHQQPTTYHPHSTTQTKISQIRLYNQLLINSHSKTAKQVVGYMGAMQAQDLLMAEWAIGIRLPGSTIDTVESAINNGNIIRTHLLRPTLHFVSSEDIYWMLELTAPQIRSSMKSRSKELGLTKALLNSSNTIIEKSLSDRKYTTREELKKEFEKAKISTKDNRLSHLLLNAELDGLICSGTIKGNKQSYALLSERVPKKNTLTKEESLAKLANIYFSSHSPATLKDFIWWSGLPAKDAKIALDSVKSNFISESFNSETYWLPNSFSLPDKNKSSAHFLPAYDEFIISYKSRFVAIHPEHNSKAISSNGLFRPVILINEKVKGTWKRSIKNDKVKIEIELFDSFNNKTKQLLKKAIIPFEQFINKKSEIIIA